MTKNTPVVNNRIYYRNNDFGLVRDQLGLSDNWEVYKIELEKNTDYYSDLYPDKPIRVLRDPQRYYDESMGTETIHIRMKRGQLYKCPHCGNPCHAHEYVDREYAHTPDKGYKVILKVNLPKLKCDNCGKTLQIRFPLARPRVSYTKEVEREVLGLLRNNTISSTAMKMHIGPWMVSDILNYNVKHAMAEQDLTNVSVLFVDETQLRKGHDYVTVFSNDEHDVVFITEGKGFDAISRFWEHLVIQGGHPDNIRVVSADMSPAFESAVEKIFPNATLVWDRFHLVQAMNKDVNGVRRRTTVRKKNEPLRNIRFTVLKRPVNFNDKDKERMEKIRVHNPDLALAFDMKEAFCEILNSVDLLVAKAKFSKWYEWVMAEGCPELIKRAEMFYSKQNRILAWFDHRVNNGVAEGINSKIQKTKNAAYGYSNVRNFSTMCMFRFGNLYINA